MQKESYQLKADKRDVVGKKVRDLRKNGVIPGVVYGSKAESVNISIPLIVFKKVFAQAGTSALIDLTIGDSAAIKVLSHEPQYNPVTDQPIHVDFYQVRMDEEIKTEIPLEFIGESEAVETLDGSLVTNRDALEVECLPTALVSEIKVDISKLKTFEDSITVADLSIPEGIKVLTEPDEMIALVEPPRSEEECGGSGPRGDDLR